MEASERETRTITAPILQVWKPRLCMAEVWTQVFLIPDSTYNLHSCTISALFYAPEVSLLRISFFTGTVFCENEALMASTSGPDYSSYWL